MNVPAHLCDGLDPEDPGACATCDMWAEHEEETADTDLLEACREVISRLLSVGISPTARATLAQLNERLKVKT